MVSSDPSLPSIVKDWPRNADGRYVCSPNRPMPNDRAVFGASQRWFHDGAKDIGECSEGCCDRYECSSCGTRWLSGGGG